MGSFSSDYIFYFETGLEEDSYIFYESACETPISLFWVRELDLLRLRLKDVFRSSLISGLKNRHKFE
jgi:hypothetical protein